MLLPDHPEPAEHDGHGDHRGQELATQHAPRPLAADHRQHASLRAQEKGPRSHQDQQQRGVRRHARQVVSIEHRDLRDVVEVAEQPDQPVEGHRPGEPPRREPPARLALREEERRAEQQQARGRERRHHPRRHARQEETVDPRVNPGEVSDEPGEPDERDDDRGDPRAERLPRAFALRGAQPQRHGRDDEARRGARAHPEEHGQPLRERRRPDPPRHRHPDRDGQRDDARELRHRHVAPGAAGIRGGVGHRVRKMRSGARGGNDRVACGLSAAGDRRPPASRPSTRRGCSAPPTRTRCPRRWRGLSR